MSTLWWIVVLWLSCTVAFLAGWTIHAELTFRMEMLEAADRRRWGHERTSETIDFTRPRMGEPCTCSKGRYQPDCARHGTAG